MNRSVERIPHFPGSRYAAELARDPRAMRFPPDLESEYHRFYLTERRSHVRVFNIIMSVLVGIALVASLVEQRFEGEIGQHVRVILIELAYLATVWAAYSRHFERAYLPTGTIAAMVIAFFGAIEVAYRIHQGDGELFALLTA